MLLTLCIFDSIYDDSTFLLMNILKYLMCGLQSFNSVRLTSLDVYCMDILFSPSSFNVVIASCFQLEYHVFIHVVKQNIVNQIVDAYVCCYMELIVWEFYLSKERLSNVKYMIHKTPFSRLVFKTAL